MSCGNPKCTHPDCAPDDAEDNVRIMHMSKSDSLRVEQALGDALNYHAVDPMERVMIVGHHPDGGLFARYSRMTAEEANWLLDRVKHSLMIGQFDFDDDQ